MNIQELQSNLKKSWSKETCYEPQRSMWSKDNPSLGQCFVTTLIVNDYFGGEILKAKSSSGISHYWNRLNGEDVDFTRSQFSNDEIFSEIVIVAREDLEENERYEALKARVES